MAEGITLMSDKCSGLFVKSKAMSVSHVSVVLVDCLMTCINH